MPTGATTADVFDAISEPRRRRILELLAEEGAQPVGELVLRLELAQPAVSKHLGVLRQAGIVTVTKRGRQRVYELDAKELKGVHDWVKIFERYWTEQLDRIKLRAERMAQERGTSME